MEKSYRKQLNGQRPYWKVLVSLTFSTLFTGLFLWFGAKCIVYFMPFVIGWFIAFIVHPVVNWLENKFGIVKKFGSAITIIVVLAAVIGLLYLTGKKLFVELQIIVTELPKMYGDFAQGVANIKETWSGLIAMLPESFRAGGSAWASDVNQTIGQIVDKISEPTVAVAERVIRKIPAILIGTIVCILSAYFIICFFI